MDHGQAERMIVGCLLRSSDTYFTLEAGESDFEDRRYRRVYHAVHELLTRGMTPDLVTVHELDDSLDPAFLASLTDVGAGEANLGYYDRIVVEHSRRRKLRRLSAQMQEWVKSRKSEEVIADIETALVEITSSGEKDRIWRVGELLPGFIEGKEELTKHPGEIPGLTTGIGELDNITQGLQKRRLIYVGARPSDGKSALMLNIASHLVLHEDRSVGIITLESSKEELLNRIFASTGRISTWRLTSGSFTKADLSRLLDVSKRLYEKRMFFYDKPNADFADVLIQARRMHRVHQVEAVFVDYIGNIGHPDRKIPRHEQMAEVSKGLKALARELEIPLIVMCQLRRDAQNRRPTLADFSDTSQIEKDADLAIMIYHALEEGETKSYLLIDKNRDGPKGSVRVVFHKEYVDFRAAAGESDERWEEKRRGEPVDRESGRSEPGQSELFAGVEES